MDRERISPDELPEPLKTKAFYLPTPNPEVIVSAVTKGACTSIKRAFGPDNQLPVEKALAHKRVGGRIVFFVRDPLERLNSAYHHFTRGRNTKFPWCVDPKDPSWAIHPEWPTLESMIDDILDNRYRDRHWIPQVENLLHDGEFVPTEVYPWSDLAPVILSLTGVALEQHNTTPGGKAPITYRVEELRNYYREDYQLIEDSQNGISTFRKS